MASQEEIRLQQEQNNLLREQNELLKQRRGTTEDTLDDLRSFANLIQDQTKQIQFQVSEKRQLRSISNQILKISQESFSGLESELGTQKNINDLTKKRQILQKSLINLESLKNKFTGDDAELNVNINKSIEDQILAIGKLNQELKTQQQLSEKISNNFGVKTFGALSDITKKIPGLSRFSEPFQNAAEAARSAASNNLGIDKFKKLRQEGVGIKDALNQAGISAKQVKLGKTKPFLAGIKSLGPALTKSLGPIALLKGLVDAFLQSDKIVGDMAKGLNMSYSEALNMKQELTAAANESGNIFVTSKGMAETLMAINKTLGTNVMLNKENLATFTELRQVAGFTNDELMGMQSLVNATDGNLKDMTGEFMAQVKLTNIKNKVALNEKQLMKEISQVSAATTLSFSKNPTLLAEAVATAKSLGMEMSKVEAIADSLLNFESSIENELQAELLLGKNINLEKARQAALNNDLKTVAEEIAKQAGSSEEFARMNRIQQEALAGAVGMSREELAKSLFLQEQIGNVSADEYNLRKKQVEELEAKGLSQAQIKEKLAKTSIEDLKNQASIQDRFNASVEKLKEVFTTVAEAIMPIIDILSSVFGLIGKIMKFLDPMIQTTLVGVAAIEDIIKGISTGFGLFGDFGESATKKQIQKAETSAQSNWGFSGDAFNEQGKGRGIFDRADDAIIPAGYGDTIIKKGKDTIALNNNDTVVAGTNLGQNTNNNQGTERALNKTNMLLEQILTKQSTVKMDATEVGTAFSVNTYSVQ